MHIPSSMLNGAICPVTTAVAAAGLGLAGYYAYQAEDKPSTPKFAAVTSLIFALQMLNYPVQNGTSGHLIGGMLAVGLLGIPFAILSMAVVLVVQTLFFADGGINALGANICNMSLVAAGLGGWLLNKITNRAANKKISLGIVAFISVLLAVAACSFEVAISGTIHLTKVLPSMLLVHALIGVGEGLLTVGVFSLLVSCESFWKENEKAVVLSTLALSFLGALFSPLASGFPDGLEWVAERLSFREFSALELPALFPDYQAFFSANESLATIAAGIIGIAIIFFFTFAAGKLFKTSGLQAS